MDEPIKAVSGEIVFYDRTTKNFNSLEQLMKIVSEEYKKNKTVEIVRLKGFDPEGKIYRLFFDFNNFAIQEGNGPPISSSGSKKQKLLGELLVELGIVTPQQHKQAIEEQSKSDNEKIGEVFIKLGFCTPEQILYVLAKQIGLFVKESKHKIKK